MPSPWDKQTLKTSPCILSCPGGHLPFTKRFLAPGTCAASDKGPNTASAPTRFRESGRSSTPWRYSYDQSSGSSSSSAYQPLHGSRVMLPTSPLRSPWKAATCFSALDANVYAGTISSFGVSPGLLLGPLLSAMITCQSPPSGQLEAVTSLKLWLPLLTSLQSHIHGDRPSPPDTSFLGSAALERHLGLSEGERSLGLTVGD